MKSQSNFLIDFGKEVVLQRIPERLVKSSSLAISHFIDNPTEKTVIAVTDTGREIVLWKGSEYDAIGQWTDADVVKRIKELYV